MKTLKFETKYQRIGSEVIIDNSIPLSNVKWWNKKKPDELTLIYENLPEDFFEKHVYTHEDWPLTEITGRATRLTQIADGMSERFRTTKNKLQEAIDIQNEINEVISIDLNAFK